MKKHLLESAVLFLLALFVSYFALTLLVPAFRVPSAVPSLKVLLASLRRRAFLKLLISLPISALMAALPKLSENTKR